jgi:hypothetical protein
VCLYLPEIESIGGNVVKIGFLLVLDQFFEGANRLGAGDFDRKDATGFVTEHNTVKIEDTIRGA